jgi:hypothetical protein
MKLHQLGPNSRRRPPPDPAFPAGDTLYAREMSARAVHVLKFQDRIINCIDPEGHVDDVSNMRLRPGAVETPIPGNYRNIDILPDAVDPHPQPMFIVTESIWTIHAVNIARLWSQISLLLNDPVAITREQVTSIDEDLKRCDGDLLSLRQSNSLTDNEDLFVESCHG